MTIPSGLIKGTGHHSLVTPIDWKHKESIFVVHKSPVLSPLVGDTY